MAVRRRWWMGIAALAVGAAVLAALPSWRLARETATAHGLGLPTEVSVEPPSLDFARLSRSWLPFELASFEPPLRVALIRVVDGKAAPQDPGLVRAWLRQAGPTLWKWRTLSRAPRLSLGPGSYREDPWASMSADRIRGAGRALVAASILGFDRRENLIAAARLSRLLRAEQGFATVLKGALLGGECLKNAPSDQLRSVETTLGPMTDFRTALQPTLARRLSELAEGERRRPKDWRENLRRLSPFVFDPKLAAFVRFRKLWQELPNDPHDFLGAARVVQARMTDVTNVQPDGTAPFFRDNALATRTMSEGLLAMGRFEALRQKARG